MEKCQQVNSMTMELSTDQVFFSRNLYPSFLFWTSLHTLKSITEFSIRDLQFSVHRSPLRLISEHHKLSSSKLVTCHHVSQNLKFCIYTEPSLLVTYTHTHTPQFIFTASLSFFRKQYDTCYRAVETEMGSARKGSMKGSSKPSKEKGGNCQHFCCVQWGNWRVI